MKPSGTKGWFDAGARVVRVLLSDASVRRDIDTVARHIDPDEAPELVRAALWTDTGVAATVIASAPKVLNAAIEAFCEVGVQVRGLPPSLVAATAAELHHRIRFRRLGMATGHVLVVAIDWMRARRAEPGGGWSQFVGGVGEALREAGIEPDEALEVPVECLASRLERAVRDDPATLDRVSEVVHRVVQRHPDLVQAWRKARRQEAS